MVPGVGTLTTVGVTMRDAVSLPASAVAGRRTKCWTSRARWPGLPEMLSEWERKDTPQREEHRARKGETENKREIQKEREKQKNRE